MKKLYLISFLSVLAGLSNTANSQSLSWAKHMRGYGITRSMAVDASGNVYTIGQYSFTVDFDPGIGTYNLTGSGTVSLFVSKLDASGNFLWAKSIGGSGGVTGWSMTIDGFSNIYITGTFNDTVDFDPGSGIYNLIGVSNSSDIFVCKLDESGNFKWAKQMDGQRPDFGRGIGVDVNGNVYTTGIFEGTCDFDPGVGTYNLLALGSSGSQDTYVSKLDSAGNFVWAKQIGGTGGSDFVNFLALDSNANIFLTGFFEATADFDPGPGVYNLTSAGDFDIFVCKLDSSGNLIWAKRMGGAYWDLGNSLTIDHSGNIITTGRFLGMGDFDPGAGTYNLFALGGQNYPNIFVSKLDPSGNFIWAKQFEGSTNGIGYAIAHDEIGNVFTSGYFTGTYDFDPGIGTNNLTSDGGADIFVSKLDSSGNFISAVKLGGPKDDECFAMVADADGYLYASGYFKDTADFDPGPGTNYLTAGYQDIYVVKLADVLTKITENISSISSVNIYPNPFSNSTTISFSLSHAGKVSIIIFDITGRSVATAANAFFKDESSEVNWDASALNSGIYFLQMNSGNYSITKKISVIH